MARHSLLALLALVAVCGERRARGRPTRTAVLQAPLSRRQSPTPQHELRPSDPLSPLPAPPPPA